jgi:hypothetical protein
MATIALFAWPVLTAIFFANYRIPVAILISIIGGYLLLPPAFGINLPLLPTFDKNNVSGLAALACALIFADRTGSAWNVPGWLPRGIIPRLLLLFVFGGFLATTFTNGDTQIVGERVNRGMTLYDGMSGLLSALMLLIPFFLARRYLATPEAQRTVLIVFALAGFAYSFLALFEVRMSPQLNRWVYGYFPHSWTQHIRGDGFRPVVFLTHGLWLSIFFTMTYVAALGLSRILEPRWRAPMFLLAGWLLLTLFLTKSLGAFIIALVLTPVVLFLTKRMQFFVAGALALTVLLYPMLRAADVVPVDRVVEFAAGIDQKRANSFEFRVYNEDMMLQRAMERPLFGWGGNGRWLVHDPESRDGGTIAVPDGYWAILFGRAGWAGYIGEFGLLVGVVILLSLRSLRTDFGPETAILTIVLLANVIDLIPNSSLVPLTWLLAGAIWGRLELGAVSQSAVAQEDKAPRPGRLYSRQRPDRSAGARLRPPDPARGDAPAYSRFPAPARK